MGNLAGWLASAVNSLGRRLNRGILDANQGEPAPPDDPPAYLGIGVDPGMTLTEWLDYLQHTVPVMSEAEWLACQDPKWMLRFLLGTDYPRVQDVEAFPHCKGSDRKLRLFACACYWRVRHLLPHPVAEAAVEVAERVADGLLSGAELSQAEARVREPFGALESRWRASRGAERAGLLPTHEALALALQAVWSEAPKAAYYASSNAYLAFAAITNGRQTAEERVQADILRCIFGDLFRPSAVAPAVLAWNDGTVRKVAQRIYDDRAFGHLPILADALEDAACGDAAILGHLRGRGPHVRGCWVVDLILGKH